MKLINEYLDMYEEQCKKYTRVVLLMQVGGFYEIYSSKDETRGNTLEIASCLNINAKVKVDGTIMAGFPLISLDKFRKCLVDNGYTVILVEQANTINDNSRRLRSVTAITSPGTDFDSTSEHVWITSLFIDFYSSNTMSIGMAVIDKTISSSAIVHDVHSVDSDKNIAMDTCIAFLEQYPPVECLISSTCQVKAKKMIQQLLPSHCIIHTIPFDKTQVLEYQGQELQTHAQYAYSILKTFLQEHFLTVNDTVIHYENSKFLELSSNAILQLDIPILCKTIGHTKTVMGKRLVYARLTRPLLDVDKIRSEHEHIQRLDYQTSEAIRKLLHGMPDIQRLHQKFAVGTISPWELQSCLHVYNAVESISKLFSFEQVEQCKTLSETISAQFILNETGCDWNTRVIACGISVELDDLFEKRDFNKSEIATLQSKLEAIFPKPISLKQGDTGFETTHTRSKIIQEKFPDLEYIKHKNFTIVTCQQLRECISTVAKIDDKISRHQQELWKDTCTQLYNYWLCDLIAQYIAHVDFLALGKWLEVNYRYSCPSTSQGERILVAKQIRHPIIERIHDHVPYTPNDLEMSIDKTTGLVLYGMNASGKTCFLKAVGLCIILAQAGLYVPAAHFEFTPFKRIMTRIAGSDNIIRGQSSFQVEMEETLSILNRADHATLILGDEVCRGTEVQSANAIVYALINELHDRKTFFVTATHLHSIVDSISVLPHISIKHTRVDIIGGELHYHRTLEDGSGPELYGLEVARALDFPDYFIHKALKFRQHLPISKSKYNSKKIVKKCESCGHVPLKGQIPLDTHHINSQCNSDKQGFHGHVHQDTLHNLMILCKKCHEKVHQQKLLIEKIPTLRGQVLRIKQL